MPLQDSASACIFAYLDDREDGKAVCVWVAHTEIDLDALHERRMDQAHKKRLPSQALQAALTSILKAGREPRFHELERVPVGEMRAAKLSWIDRMVVAGHPVANPEAQEIRAAREKSLYNWPEVDKESRNIFAAEDPRTGAVHHVSATRQSAGQARSSMRYYLRRDPTRPEAQWLKELAKGGVQPRLRLLEIVARSEMRDRRRYWAQELEVSGGLDPREPRPEWDSESEMDA